jgi:type I restriction enzyme S subunit
MRANYKPLGKYIQPVIGRNNDLGDLPLVGLSIQKKFIPSIANTIGTDMSTYRVIEKNQFAYGPVTSRNGDKITIALFNDYEKALISQAYIPFEVKDTNELDPEYLMMWFRRPEFDRYARFKSHGSAREIFDWEEMCNTLLPVPHIDKQREIVKEYNTIQNRINLNNQQIQKLEETAQAIYREWFVERIDSENLPVGWKFEKIKNICSKIGSGSTPTGGKESYSDSGISLIRSTNIFDYNFSLDDLAFINEQQADKLKNVRVAEKDILFNITGVSVARCCMVPVFVLPARVNQHVMIIRPKKELHISFYLLLNLCSTDSKNTLLGISQSGSTREAITKTEIEEFEIIIPDSKKLKQFEAEMQKIFAFKDLKSLENQKLTKLKELLLSKLATVEN